MCLIQIGAADMKEFDSSLLHAQSWLSFTQMKENVDVKYYRQMNLVNAVYSLSNLTITLALCTLNLVYFLVCSHTFVAVFDT